MSRAGGLGKRGPFLPAPFWQCRPRWKPLLHCEGGTEENFSPTLGIDVFFFPPQCSAVPFHLCSNFVGPKIEYESPYRAWLQPQHMYFSLCTKPRYRFEYVWTYGYVLGDKKSLRYIRYTCILEKRWNRESWSSKSEGCTYVSTVAAVTQKKVEMRAGLAREDGPGRRSENCPQNAEPFTAVCFLFPWGNLFVAPSFFTCGRKADRS